MSAVRLFVHHHSACNQSQKNKRCKLKQCSVYLIGVSTLERGRFSWANIEVIAYFIENEKKRSLRVETKCNFPTDLLFNLGTFDGSDLQTAIRFTQKSSIVVIGLWILNLFVVM